MINFRKVRSFEGGYSTDLTENIERKNTYQKAQAGRLYSKNGVLSFSGGAGTKLVYQNTDIVKYLGFYSFKDETIIFAKCIKGASLGGSTVTICNDTLIALSFDINADSNDNIAVPFTTEISDNSSTNSDCYDVEVPPADPADFNANFTCSAGGGATIDFGEYYDENANVPN